MALKLLQSIKETFKKTGLRGCWNGFLTRVTVKTLPEKVHSQPRFIQIEPTTKCNLSCKMCGLTYWYKERKDMSFEDFKIIINQFPYLESISLQGAGEPLINPDIFKMIEYAKNRKIKVGFNSNAMLLTPKIAERLILSGLNLIAISLDGATANMYEKVRVKGNFEEVIQNINGLIELKKKLKMDKPVVTIAAVIMKDNFKEMPQIVKLAFSLGIKEVGFQHINYNFAERKNYNLDISLKEQSLINKDTAELQAVVKETLRMARVLNIKLNLPSFRYKLSKPIKALICKWPWVSTYINCSGYVLPCCSMPDEDEICFGSLLRENFNKIWNCEGYRNFRSKLLSSNPPYICKDCVGYYQS